MKNSIKIWPHLDGLSTAIIPYFDATLNLDNHIYIDFSNVKSINSSGIAITLVKLLPIIDKYKECVWSLEVPELKNINDFLTQTGIYNIIIKKIHNRDLYFNLVPNEKVSIFESFDQNQNKIISFPLYWLDFKSANRRICVEDFTDWLLSNLISLSQEYNFKLNILSKLLKEIAKNSEDHTNSDAIFGMDIIINLSTDTVRLLFSFCDFGQGIHGNIKKNISSDSRYRFNASAKFGFVDSYHAAYTPGFTTSKNTRNKGIGMSMIIDCVNLLNLNLAVFDAKSMGYIPKMNTHEEIRRNFWNTGNNVGFYYYGRLNLNKF